MAVHPLYRLIGAAIKKSRKDRDLTQEGLSDRVGISRASLANIETGRQRLLVHQLYRIAEHLGLEISALLPDSNSMQEIKALDGITFSGTTSPEQQRQIVQIIQPAENVKHS